jgi:fructosamine-3-kinase
MSLPTIWTHIAAAIAQKLDRPCKIVSRVPVAGGCINQTELITDNTGARFFVKIGRSASLEMFAAEARGLVEMAATATITVPVPICWGQESGRGYLVMTDLDLRSSPSDNNWREMGRQLAALHRYPISPSPKFGWHIHNTIGSTPQVNTWETDWTTFFRDWRIGYQIELVKRRKSNIFRAEELMAAIPQILAHHHPVPSLVHGDLWGGNAGFTRDSQPAIFDPATYWGDREVDLAMTELFGGFPSDFYAGYNEVYPLATGYDRRRHLYNLYHLLNHENLFGGYLDRVNATIDRVLADI